MQSSKQEGNGAAIPVIDYEGSQYRTEFWEGRGRSYEDATERLALKKLMPPVGVRIAEIGAGFGRLADLYSGYEQVILFDYSRTLLQDAAKERGHDPRFVFVAGNIYSLPLATGVLDTLLMVRVMHHLADVPRALTQLERILHRQSVAVIEYANKRNLKAFMRWATRRQQWSPADQEPVEFVELHYDFHPVWMEKKLTEAGFCVAEQYAVSHFRLPLLKDRVNPQQLAKFDSVLFGLGGRFPVAPSVFVQATTPQAAHRAAVDTAADALGGLFRCPKCQTDGLERTTQNIVRCPQCGERYGRKNGVWDFKEPVA